MIEKEIVRNSLGQISYLSQKLGIPIAFIGSVGRSLALEEIPNHICKDIDVMRLDKPDEVLPSELYNAANPYLLDLVFRRRIAKNHHSYLLKYKRISVPVEPHIFDVKLTAEDELPTLDLNVHLHQYLIINPFRKKDLCNALKFSRQIKDKPHLPDSDMYPFHEYYKLKTKSYPFDQVINNIRVICQAKMDKNLKKVLMPFYHLMRYTLNVD